MPWLDWLRFGAAFMVLLAHVRVRVFAEYGALDPASQGYFAQALFATTRLGHESVLVFFVLSGFLVGGRATERALAGRFRWADYAVDRVSRIVVPLLPAVGFTVAAMALQGTPPSLGYVLGNLLQVQGLAVPTLTANGPLWSLPYEVWFYVACGALMVLFEARGLAAGVAAAAFGVAAVILVLLEPVYLICWCLGAGAYHLRRSRLDRGEIVFALLLVALGVVISQLAAGSRSLDLNVAGEDGQRGGALILCLGISLLIRNLSAASVAIPRFDALGGLLAEFSYTLYLFHYPLLFLLAAYGLQQQTRVGPAELAVAAGLTAGCMAFSYVAYLLFEKHTSVVRRAIKSKLMPKPAPASAQA